MGWWVAPKTFGRRVQVELLGKNKSIGQRVLFWKLKASTVWGVGQGARMSRDTPLLHGR